VTTSFTKSKKKKGSGATPLLNDNILFNAGDRVVHPRHGLGRVTKLVIKEFVQGEKRPYFEISFPGSTLWVPLNLSTSGIRKLSVKSEIISCRQLLKAPARPLNKNPRLRQTELVEHLKEGTISAYCEVVRDLTAHNWHKSLSGGIATFLNATQEVLCQEWAAVEDVTHSEAVSEIETLIERGRPDNKYE
jgi:RNA polymerase-interacting CarD/CdnL/TRCF family regulator